MKPFCHSKFYHKCVLKIDCSYRSFSYYLQMSL
uniref:Uncharacterized protein n=1 Tax=Anguilla anguilla TaxID=7936 RepID=A0A0E9VNW9_ANGAN